LTTAMIATRCLLRSDRINAVGPDSSARIQYFPVQFSLQALKCVMLMRGKFPRSMSTNPNYESGFKIAAPAGFAASRRPLMDAPARNFIQLRACLQAPRRTRARYSRRPERRGRRRPRQCHPGCENAVTARTGAASPAAVHVDRRLSRAGWCAVRSRLP